MQFSASLLEKAIRSQNDELAWKKDEAFQAAEELARNNFAILGYDAWGIAPVSARFSPLTYIDKTTMAVGILPTKKGNDCVFEWHSDKNANESWEDYVHRTKIEVLSAIQDQNAEEIVIEEFKNQIYYNLVYSSMQEYEELQPRNT